MREQRFCWETTVHVLGQLEGVHGALSRPEGAPWFEAVDGARATPPAVFPLGEAHRTLDEYLASLPFEEGELRTGGQVFFLLQAGAAALGVWKDGALLKHKVIKKYVVRAGQGRAQSAQDRRRPARSAGARLRSQNQRSLLAEIGACLQGWSEEVRACERIFYSAPVRLWGEVLREVPGLGFAGDDPRLQKIALDLRRPGMAELRHIIYEMTHGRITYP